MLDDAAAEQLVGRHGLRHVTFDCNTNWVFPAGPGWYVLPPGELWIVDWLGQSAPEVVYRHRPNAYGPDYAIAYWPGLQPAPTGQGSATPALLLSCSPALTPDTTESHDAPAVLCTHGARGVEWVTAWQVVEATAAPLSLQAHLIAADGTRQVADGLGFAAEQWQPGDWFIQRHAFTAPAGRLETGLYNYATLERVGPTHTLPTD